MNSSLGSLAMNTTAANITGTTSQNATDPVSIESTVYRLAIPIYIAGILTSILFAVVFVVAFPFGAVLLKYRVNYVPVRGQVGNRESEEDNNSKCDPVINSYFGMFHRVLLLESWGGLFKGFVPTCIKVALGFSLSMIVLLGSGFKDETQPTQSIRIQLMCLPVAMLFSLPFDVIINRTITTPHAVCSLRALLSERERRRPWLLYLSPGLFVSGLVRGVYTIAIDQPFNSMIDNNPDLFPKRSILRICVLLTRAIIHTSIVCPIDVIFARLSVQRNEHKNTQSPLVEVENEKSVTVLEIDARPYAGFSDCFRRVKQEEGYFAFLRAWWIVFIMDFWSLPVYACSPESRIALLGR